MMKNDENLNMEFLKYNSIENTYREKETNHILNYYPKEEFIIQEKAHGSNFSMFFNGIDIKCAKRTDFILPDEQFNNYQNIVSRYSSNIQDLYKNKCEEGDILVVYGEIIGGHYDHPEVPKKNDISKVQKGVQYSPDVEFYCFDIKINGEFLDMNETETLLKDHEFFYARTLFRGTFEECLKYPNDGQSKISEWLGYPPLEEDNTLEGVVIKPVKPLYQNNGSRIIFKNKNEKFAEKTKVPKRPRKEVVPLKESVQKLLDIADEYINDNRLSNVVSKLGQVTQKDFGKVSGFFVKDIIEDMIKDGVDIDSLDKIDKKSFNKSLGKKSALFMQTKFVNIIDGML